MTLTMPFPTGSRLFPLTPLLFARRTSRELRDDDFGDHGDDFDDFRHRRPRRRRFFTFMLILLLIVGVWYVSVDQDVRSSVIKRVTTAIGATLNLNIEDILPQSGNDKELFSLSQAAPIPVFRERQQVAVTLNGISHVRLRLSHDAEGPHRGSSVKTGEVLTITDGRLVNHQWVYSVKTQSGASGWIQEKYLRAHF